MLTAVALERQVGLGRERGDPDARQVTPTLVDDEPPLPLREELAVEREQVVELEMPLEREQCAPLHLLQAGERSASGASSAANGAKFSDTRS